MPSPPDGINESPPSQCDFSVNGRGRGHVGRGHDRSHSDVVTQELLHVSEDVPH